MKIIIVSAMFPPARTGTSYYAQNLATALTADGHEVSVVTVENDNKSPESYNFDVHYLSALHVPLSGFFKHFKVCAFSKKNYSVIPLLPLMKLLLMYLPLSA